MRLAPKGMDSQMLALWFLAQALGDTVGGQLARALEPLEEGQYFATLGGAATMFGVVLLALSPLVRRLMRGVR